MYTKLTANQQASLCANQPVRDQEAGHVTIIRPISEED